MSGTTVMLGTRVSQDLETTFVEEAVSFDTDKANYLRLLVQHRNIIMDALRGKAIVVKPSTAIRLKLEKIAQEKGLDLNGLAQVLLEESADSYGKQVFSDTSISENAEIDMQVSGNQKIASVIESDNTPDSTTDNTCNQRNHDDFRQSDNSHILSEEEELELITSFKILLKNVFIAREILFEKYGNKIFNSLSMDGLDRLFFDGLNKDELQLIIEE